MALNPGAISAPSPPQQISLPIEGKLDFGSEPISPALLAFYKGCEYWANVARAAEAQRANEKAALR